MPISAKHICSNPGCHTLVADGGNRCSKHANERYASKSKPGDPWYTSARWRKLRDLKLSVDPLCVGCAIVGRSTAAREVHHVKPRKDFPELAYELSNLEGHCTSCHSKITAQERRKRNAN